jgi:hypothetical protein
MVTIGTYLVSYDKISIFIIFRNAKDPNRNLEPFALRKRKNRHKSNKSGDYQRLPTNWLKATIAKNAPYQQT